jgi:NADH-quinone oxidoreductase subunit L
MLDLLWLVPTFPLLGFLILFVTAGALCRRSIAIVGVGSVGLSMLVFMVVIATFIHTPPLGHAYTQTLWTWVNVMGFDPKIAFYLDPLSLVMTLVVTFVGFLIHLYSAEFMIDDDGYSRFFAYMNLFVAFMLILVLANNLLLLFVGWEGVGLCSFLLIGFWYDKPENGAAAQKAFIVTRIGDVAMAVGLFLLFTHLGTLNIQELMQRAVRAWPVGTDLPIAAALLLLGGALGKSAQLPLQTWLPDAMAGPSPVSALIHAATMVTAGVYLIARMHVLYGLAPSVEHVIAIGGALTLLLAAFSALTQWDIKRVLAYSTMSQVGYMFLANGVGAYSPAIFHFMIHAFFKALLFLSAGFVVQATGNEHNIFKLGGLRKELPLIFWPFLIGASTLAAVPFVTAGFYSKGLILQDVWSSASGGPWLWAAAWVGEFLTGMYTFRLVFLVFFGESKTPIRPQYRVGYRVMIPLIILSALCLVGGFINLPPGLGNAPWFTDFLHSALPPTPKVSAHGGIETSFILMGLAAAASLGGIYTAWLFFRHGRGMDWLANTGVGVALHRLWFTDWGFDGLYDRALVRPYRYWAHLNRNDFIDSVYDGVAWVTRRTHRLAATTQNGQLRRYTMVLAIGSVIFITMVVLL